jgi:hypothetical protein
VALTTDAFRAGAVPLGGGRFQVNNTGQITSTAVLPKGQTVFVVETGMEYHGDGATQWGSLSPAVLPTGSVGITGGTGVPSNSAGNNGDVYFRVDGTTGSAIYQKRSGSWVAIT